VDAGTTGAALPALGVLHSARLDSVDGLRTREALRMIQMKLNLNSRDDYRLFLRLAQRAGFVHEYSIHAAAVRNCERALKIREEEKQKVLPIMR